MEVELFPEEQAGVGQDGEQQGEREGVRVSAFLRGNCPCAGWHESVSADDVSAALEAMSASASAHAAEGCDPFVEIIFTVRLPVSGPVPRKPEALLTFIAAR